MRPFSLVVAVDAKLGIGKAGGIPWRLPNEMKYFKDITTAVTKKDGDKRNAVIMGRKTWESIPEKFRPLPDRVNIVVSKTMAEAGDGVHVASSLEAALHTSANLPVIDKVFVIGGGQLYRECLERYWRLCHYVYITRIEADCNADTFFPDTLETPQSPFRVETESEVQEEKGMRYRFCKYMQKNEEETQYLDLIRRIIQTGNQKGDRTGTGTLSMFGAQMRFNLRDGCFPLLTSKRVFWRGVAEELLWFVKGDTNANHLKEKNIHIWDGNGSRQFLDNLGLTDREEGDLGPVYGFQWRHFGAEYKDMHTDYTGQGIDQLQQVINTLRTNPNDRRILMSAWNPVAMPLMALPPCHCFCQFYVADGELSCQMYQRSCDMGLGVPFNIASYALLTRLIAQVCGLQAGELIHTLGDAHVYSNHVNPLLEQLQRSPQPFPTLHIKRDTTNIEDFVFDDFVIHDYNPLPTIKMEMAV
jgi:dihydrofolate reductase/thymidylate synthase|eukprot:CAMPEP_0174281634 /NCGR_PEP_ID=MMETSP0809-20121228/2017_1 /TAXON_ID=73025 ORGANISM="Eutreptiella gymnastica-like, Strain CCMP1594" /NCGR_SAMPLE_ID=MMETSP0809 /ASSEMBLY_ACC=CAM_ASM_000658 /LENGTH=470 /DNA_ID=CAMNT_0015375295 /DNA_START=160 /DNA_END=1572 /DNA_ORIENTATION=+